MLGNKGTKQFYRTGGTRGGQAQFKWDDVKGDKDRQNYLGHSVNAATGRWQNGKDLFWYSKDKTVQDSMENEKARMREQDDELINEALGLKPKKQRRSGYELDSADMKYLLERGNTERNTTDIERVNGLGLGVTKRHDHIQILSSIEKEIIKMKTGLSEESSSHNSINLIVPSATVEIRNDVHENKYIDEKSRKHKKDKKDKHNHKSHKRRHDQEDDD